VSVSVYVSVYVWIVCMCVCAPAVHRQAALHTELAGSFGSGT
jgi:hypothetical protein